MAESPYFPPPRGKPEGGAYRAPARPLADPIAQLKPLVVSRPAEPSSRGPLKSAAGAHDMVSAMVDERTYWERHTTFARFPRPIGGVLALFGGWIVWESLFHDGYYGVSGTLFGPVALLTGVWALLFGYPLGRGGRPPGWWTLGQVASIVVGLGLGAGLRAVFAVLAVLATGRSY